MTGWDNRSWCWWPGVLLRQHYKVTMSVHSHKSVQSPPPPMGLSHNREAQLHTSLDHYLLVVPPLLHICSLCHESVKNHPSYICIYIYSKTSLTDHLHKSTTPPYRPLYMGPKYSHNNCILILETDHLPKWTH